MTPTFEDCVAEFAAEYVRSWLDEHPATTPGAGRARCVL